MDRAFLEMRRDETGAINQDRGELAEVIGFIEPGFVRSR
jgi:hypothetical protein